MTSAIFATLGGVLIGLSASLLLLLHGRIAGISGILAGALGARADELAWRLWFLGGLVGGGALIGAFAPSVFPARLDATPLALVGAGLLVGFGTRLGSGCTSGHGVCGIGRGSLRSIAATGIFMATGAATVFVVRHLVGGGR